MNHSTAIDIPETEMTLDEALAFIADYRRKFPTAKALMSLKNPITNKYISHKLLQELVSNMHLIRSFGDDNMYDCDMYYFLDAISL